MQNEKYKNTMEEENRILIRIAGSDRDYNSQNKEKETKSRLSEVREYFKTQQNGSKRTIKDTKSWRNP